MRHVYQRAKTSRGTGQVVDKCMVCGKEQVMLDSGDSTDCYDPLYDRAPALLNECKILEARLEKVRSHLVWRTPEGVEKDVNIEYVGHSRSRGYIYGVCWNSRKLCWMEPDSQNWDQVELRGVLDWIYPLPSTSGLYVTSPRPWNEQFEPGIDPLTENPGG